MLMTAYHVLCVIHARLVCGPEQWLHLLQLQLLRYASQINHQILTSHKRNFGSKEVKRLFQLSQSGFLLQDISIGAVDEILSMYKDDFSQDLLISQLQTLTISFHQQCINS